MITPTLMKFAHQHRDAVLSLLSPSWTSDDFDQFVKGLLALADKQEDITQVCHAIREGYLSHHSLDEVESCYRHLHKFLKQKPITNSPKRRRAISKPEMLASPVDGPLPAMGGLSLNSPPSGNPFSFLSNSAPSSPTGFQYPSIGANLHGLPTSTSSVLPGTVSFSGGLMRPPMEYGTVPSVMDMDLSAPSLSMNSMNAIGSLGHSWNSLAFSFDLQNVPHSLGLPPGTPLVSSHN
jgi:hypothetical protein